MALFLNKSIGFEGGFNPLIAIFINWLVLVFWQTDVMGNLINKQKMKFIKTILDRPYLVILITAIIALVFPDIYILYSLGLIFVLFAISIVYTITQKKWLRLTLSILGYFVFFVLWTGFVLFKGVSDDLKPQIEIGDSKFYSNEILTWLIAAKL